MPPPQGPVIDPHCTTVPTSRGHLGLRKVTANLTARAWHALEATVHRTGDTKTETINRALQVYNYINELMHRGAVVYVQDPNGKPERLTIF